MEKFRFILAILFLTEVITGLMHLVIGIILEQPYPLIIYVIMPAVVLAFILITFVLSPILDWITGL